MDIFQISFSIMWLTNPFSVNKKLTNLLTPGHQKKPFDVCTKTRKWCLRVPCWSVVLFPWSKCGLRPGRFGYPSGLCGALRSLSFQFVEIAKCLEIFMKVMFWVVFSIGNLFSRASVRRCKRSLPHNVQALTIILCVQFSSEQRSNPSYNDDCYEWLL